MMTLPERFQRPQQLEPVAAFRPGGLDDPHKFKYFADMPAPSMGVHHPPPGFGPPPPMPPMHAMPPPGPPAFRHIPPPPSPQVPTLATANPMVPSPPKGPPKATPPVTEEFSNLSLKRVSKALKLISPMTNTPIRAAEESNRSASSVNSVASSESDKDSCGVQSSQGNGADCAKVSKSRDAGSIEGSVLSKSPPAELPTGSRLRRWIACEPESPVKTADSSSTTSVSSDFAVEKSTHSERKDSGFDLEVCGSEDSVVFGGDMKCFHSTIGKGGDVPKSSKLWIWMGKEEN
ncbi:hypothetical protein BSKO_03783 [Bryopsis sp. KO-2023]|nr:hypothetical protein BSKO_03783 [Bryopsis sp. KO-2023]